MSRLLFWFSTFLEARQISVLDESAAHRPGFGMNLLWRTCSTLLWEGRGTGGRWRCGAGVEVSRVIKRRRPAWII